MVVMLLLVIVRVRLVVMAVLAVAMVMIGLPLGHVLLAQILGADVCWIGRFIGDIAGRLWR
jgi:hypothetical protein